MTTIRNGGRGGLLRLVSRWFGRRQPIHDEIGLIALEGLDGHLARDIGLSLHSEHYPRRDIRPS